MTTLLFPGQGTISIGTGSALAHAFPAQAAPLWEEVERLRPGLTQQMRRGPAQRLSATENAQVVVTAVNLAALAVLRAHHLTYRVSSGHSVGMLSALVAAESIGPGDALRLAAIRGELMGRMAEGTSMVSLTPVAVGCAERIAEGAAAAARETVVVGLVNGPATVVLSGSTAGLARATEMAAAEGISTTPLAVSHAFHSPFMRPAQVAWAEVVAQQHFAPPACLVLSDLDGAPIVAVADIRDALVAQLTNSVRWDRVCESLIRSDSTDCVECGDSKVLRSLARAYPDLAVVSMAAPAILSAIKSGRSLALTGRPRSSRVSSAPDD